MFISFYRNHYTPVQLDIQGWQPILTNEVVSTRLRYLLIFNYDFVFFMWFIYNPRQTYWKRLPIFLLLHSPPCTIQHCNKASYVSLNFLVLCKSLIVFALMQLPSVLHVIVEKTDEQVVLKGSFEVFLKGFSLNDHVQFLSSNRSVLNNLTQQGK